jgi:hypothetical protein
VTGFPKKSVSLALSAFVVVALWFQLSTLVHGQLSTTDHLADPGFWPTKKDPPRDQYVGDASCASCHPAISASQKSTSMRQTTVHPEDADLLHSNPLLNFSFGPYRYLIKTSGKTSTYSVTDGKQTQSGTLLWTFGTGRVGQSYIFKKDDGKLYEARVTYFHSLKALDFTPDRALKSAGSLDEAMDRTVDESEVSRCLACHTTASATGRKPDQKNLIPGVTCEACHGPASKHVSAMKLAKATGDLDVGALAIFNPARLSPTDSVDFCGACHSTWWDVKLSGIRGVSNVKAQPYRLESSKCWGKGDARLTCIACHDPHVEVSSDPAHYDKVCLSCHVGTVGMKTTAEMPGPACHVGSKECVTCHMPKVFVPEMHYGFPDHRIRIVRAGENYPD